MGPAIPSVSIIVPTYGEADNLPVLVPQIAPVMRMRGWQWEVIVIDDNSQDGTAEVLEQLSATFPQLRYKIRTQERSLSSAVLAGISMAHYGYTTVMDGDLSHAPESIPELVDKLIRDEADFVIGSRYVAGGGTQDWSLLHRLTSAVAVLLSRPFAGKVRDPMAGFFAIRRSTLETADLLNPIGYKIGLELMAKCRVARVAEVPITFHKRLHGQPKLNGKEQFRYLEHLSRLYDYKYPKVSPSLKFLMVAGIGAVVCLGTIALLDSKNYLFAISLAAGLGAMILVTLVFFMRYVHMQREYIMARHPYSEFLYISIAEFLAGYFVAATTNSTNNMVRASVGIAVLLAVRYTLRKVFLHDIHGMHGVAKPGSSLRLTMTTAGEPNTAASA